jgi:1-acyl-sn-glycerol-3-phosphate acyltransferase
VKQELRRFSFQDYPQFGCTPMKFCSRNFLKRIPLTLYDYAVFYAGLVEFSLICLVWSVLAMIMHPLLPRETGCRLGRLGIMLAFRLFLGTLTLSGRFKFDLSALDGLRNEKALIIAPNHPSLWDVVMVTSRLPNVACIMKALIVNNILLGGGARLARYIRNDSIRQMIALAVADLKRGNHLLLFPEGTRTVQCPIGPLKGGIGVIANRARVSVQTVIIETDSPFLSKGWPAYKKPPMPMTYRLRLGRRFDPPSTSAALVDELEHYFTEQLSRPASPSPRRNPPSDALAAELTTD